MVTPDGAVVELGGMAGDVPGYDLVGAFVGSEGTLGVATKVTVRLLRTPQAVQTLLAGFRDIDSAGKQCQRSSPPGSFRRRIEMMDALAISAAEMAVRCEYPEGQVRSSSLNSDGPAAEVQEGLVDVERLCVAKGAFEISVAADNVEEADLLAGPEYRFAAMGRLSPSYIVQDGVVP